MACIATYNDTLPVRHFWERMFQWQQGMASPRRWHLLFSGYALMPFVDTGNGEQEYQPMAAERLMEARRALGGPDGPMKRLELGYLLGMSGEKRNIYATIKRYEEGRRDISPMVERLVLMLLWHKADFGYLPDLDRGERSPTQPVFENGSPSQTGRQ